MFYYRIVNDTKTKNSLLKVHENNFDILRILSTFAVIAIHASSWAAPALKATDSTPYIYTILLYNNLPRFAVPCFVMLTGAFDLSNEKNADYKYFYRKTFVKLGIPTLIFSFIMTAQKEVFLFYDHFSTGKVITKSEVLMPIINLIKGCGVNPLWYMYMMIFVFLLVPVIINLKKQIGERNFRRVAWAFLIITMCGMHNLNLNLSWDVGNSIYFVAYLMIGYVLREYGLNKKNNIKGTFLILLGFAVEIIIIIMSYCNLKTEFTEYGFIEPLSPIVALASVLIFSGFSYVKCKLSFTKITKHSFNIFLFHNTAIYFFINFRFFYNGNNYIVSVPVLILASFITSLILSVLYNKIWSFVDKNGRVSNKICKVLRLQ